ncbi:hypothetical protein HYY75_01305, partial [bacterium]|nr:hypothetical protein [bacterium]
FWSRKITPTSQIKVRIWPEAGPIPFGEVNASDEDWKRRYISFSVPSAQIIRVELIQNGLGGDEAYLDGVMLEKWVAPPGAPPGMSPVPSAWANEATLVSALASQTLQQSVFRELVASDTSSASLSWWLEW